MYKLFSEINKNVSPSIQIFKPITFSYLHMQCLCNLPDVVLHLDNSRYVQGVRELKDVPEKNLITMKFILYHNS